MSSYSREIAAIEIPLLISAVQWRYGYDLSEYRPDFLNRRIQGELKSSRLGTISQLQEKLLHDDHQFDHFLKTLSPRPDPAGGFFHALGSRVVPFLKTYARVKVWLVGSAVKEIEAVGRVLEEGGILEKTTLYCTHPSQEALREAKAQAFPKPLANRVAYFQHNPTIDSSFNEFNLIISRNLLSSLAGPVQERLHELFHESLCPLGVLGLGKKDPLLTLPIGKQYKRLGKTEPFFQRVS